MSQEERSKEARRDMRLKGVALVFFIGIIFGMIFHAIKDYPF